MTINASPLWSGNNNPASELLSIIVEKMTLNRFTLNLSGRLVEFGRPAVMGILNITPDSFFCDSRTPTAQAVTDRVDRLLAEGVDIIDVGGCSTRPGFDAVDPDEEWRRVAIGIEAVRSVNEYIPLSVDTFRASVAKKALAAGADIVNDVSGFAEDSALRQLIVDSKSPYVLTHYGSQRLEGVANPAAVTSIVLEELARTIEDLRRDGVADIIVDPGFGFGKTVEQNFVLMSNLDKFAILGAPLLVGISRKSMIFRTLGCTPSEALNGTTVLNTFALMRGADILRVHDVKAAREAIELIHCCSYPEAILS